MYQQLNSQTVHSGLDPYHLSTLASVHSHKLDRTVRTKNWTLTSVSMNGIPSRSYKRCGTHTPGQISIQSPVLGSIAPPRFTGQDNIFGWLLHQNESWSVLSPRARDNFSSTVLRVSSPSVSPSHQKVDPRHGRLDQPTRRRHEVLTRDLKNENQIWWVLQS